MKKVFFTCLLAITTCFASAQVASDIKASPDGKMGEFTEWKKVDVSFDDGSSATIEYRIALVMRKGIGCHYDLEVKNTSDMTINLRLKSSYYDKLVKGQYGDEIKEKVKGGKGVVARFVAQGCKKEKGSDADDYTACTSCDFGASIFVSK